MWLSARPQVDSMSSSGPAAEGEGTPAQPASEKEPEMPGPREESEEEDEDDEEEEEEEEEEKGGRKVASLVMDFTENRFLASFFAPGDAESEGSLARMLARFIPFWC